MKTENTSVDGYGFRHGVVGVDCMDCGREIEEQGKKDDRVFCKKCREASDDEQ